MAQQEQDPSASDSNQTLGQPPFLTYTTQACGHSCEGCGRICARPRGHPGGHTCECPEATEDSLHEAEYVDLAVNVTTTSTTTSQRPQNYPSPQTRVAYSGEGGKLHPLLHSLEEHVQAEAKDITRSLQEWASCYEQWMLTLAGIPSAQWSEYQGRCASVMWTQVPLSDIRVGPVASISVPPNLSLAGRAAVTGLKIVQHALEQRDSRRWSKALSEFLTSSHASIFALSRVLGHERLYRALSDLSQLAGWMSKAIDSKPEHLESKWAAITALVGTAIREDSKEAKTRWLESLFQHGARKGHRWAKYFLEHIELKTTDDSILDLASGNGVIASEISKKIPNATLHLLDDSFLAVESGKLNITGANIHHHYDNTLADFKSESFDLIVTNPPFHFEYEIDIQIPIQLFKECFRCLKPSGNLQLVANKHLNYKTHLSSIFRLVEVLAENDSFIVYKCSK